MLQRTVLGSALTQTGLAQDIAARAPGLALDSNSWRQLRRALQMPRTLREYVIFLFGLILVCGAMSIHVLLSADILKLRVELYTLRAEQESMEQRNAEFVWQIAEAGSLPRIQAWAKAQGYSPVTKREYVQIAAPAPSAPLDANPVGVVESNNLAVTTTPNQADDSARTTDSGLIGRLSSGVERWWTNVSESTATFFGDAWKRVGNRP